MHRIYHFWLKNIKLCGLFIPVVCPPQKQSTISEIVKGVSKMKDSPLPRLLLE